MELYAISKRMLLLLLNSVCFPVSKFVDEIIVFADFKRFSDDANLRIEMNLAYLCARDLQRNNFSEKIFVSKY